ncbi:MAG TPA: PcfJ domain-containing protein [Candidatus Aquilonibacter sp.]|nr:PcfJ domain-containing protein [Candidatus Aquilonibacter sp.]
MSWSERYVQDRRAQTDRAIHRACECLASDPHTFEKFQELLTCSRKLAPRLFEAPVDAVGRHAGVDALVNLARFRDAHIRSIATWPGPTASWRPAVASLVQHLTCSYRIPAFLASVWYACDAEGDKKRAWVTAHSHGASFRSLDLPLAMTRRMEHIFLESRDHLAFEAALRRAEMLAVGMRKEFVTAVLSTRLATDLRNGAFWRTVWIFLAAHSNDVDSAQVGPMIDYIQAIRHDRLRIDTQDGVVEIAPPQPNFSIKGRTASSMLRLVREWHRGLGGDCSASSLSWTQSSFKPWLIEEPRRKEEEAPRRWQMVELTTSGQLREEGAALQHCVSSYARLCYRGSSSIWSLRMWRNEKVRPVLTVEVDPGKRAVIQARGTANRSASGKARRLLLEWAAREGLVMAI